MKTYELRNPAGIVNAFEVPNHFLTSGAVARFFKRCPGCTVTSKRKLFSSQDEHVRFLFKEREFAVSEPFGDNSRLLVAPAENTEVEENILQSLIQAVSTTPLLRLW